ncbi:kelch-like protein 18 isoform X3 [Folsomia candida]|uniref:kelch-like protein 18 isoform X3 n=1 Tax=Folsomia candida TaxID=158441 RepID=UPI001604EDDD|nr:kelch-like protein 18 isoform X3 [Folsomia candida]
MWKRIQLCSPRKKQKPSCSKRGTTYLSGVSGTGGVRQLIFRFGVSIDLRSKLTPGRTLVEQEGGAAGGRGGDMSNVLEDTEHEVFHQEDLPLDGFPVMEQIRNEGLLCDIKLKVDESVIQAHRIVLAATIPYFHAMFTNDMIESKQNEVTLKGLDPDAVEQLINFAYTGRITINVNNVQSIMLSSSFLQINKVKDACAKFLGKRLTPDNVVGIRAFADTLNCSSVVKESDRFIQKHFLDVSKSEEFSQLGISDIINILSRDELAVDSEEQVFNVMIKWVKKDTQIRCIHLPELLQCVRMPLLTPQFITDYVASEILVRSSHPCRDLIDEARDYFLIPERRPLSKTFRIRPRCFDDTVGYMFVVGGLTKTGDSVSTVEIFDPIQEQWRIAEAITMQRSRVGVAVMKKKLFAIGGFNGTERLSTVEMYDSVTKTWSKIASMRCKRSAVGCAALNDKLYTAGGYDGNSSLNTVECFYPERGDWFMITPMMKHRSAAGVVAFQGFMYAIGGHDGLSIFDSAERFDPSISAWHPIASMNTKRCRLGAAVIGDKLYVAGGYDGATFLRSVEVYDPITDVWTECSPMKMMRSRVALVANMDKLWAIGGYDGVTNLSSVECYDPAKNEWTDAPPMCAHEGGVGVGVIPLDCV